MVLDRNLRKAKKKTHTNLPCYSVTVHSVNTINDCKHSVRQFSRGSRKSKMSPKHVSCQTIFTLVLKVCKREINYLHKALYYISVNIYYISHADTHTHARAHARKHTYTSTHTEVIKCMYSGTSNRRKRMLYIERLRERKTSKNNLN